MTPGPTLVIKCPHCGALALQPTCGSGNTFGARYWTDGKMDAPMLPEEPEITRCGPCAGYYWVRTAKKVGEFDPSEDTSQVPREWLDAELVRDLAESEFLQAIELGVMLKANDEVYLRMHAWWAGNDRWRDLEADDALPANTTTPEAHRANMDKLMALLGARGPQQRLMKAELARELGQFDECLRLIKTAPPDYAIAASLIREMAQAGSTQVAEIPSVGSRRKGR